MRDIHTLDINRRRLLLGAVGLAAGAGAAVGALSAAGPADAQSKFSQKMAKYQPTPKGAQRCDSCTQFVPATSCKVVDGTISGSGWCFLYAHK